MASGAGDLTTQMIDSTVIPLPGSACLHAREGAHQHGRRGQKRGSHLNALGRSRVGFSTKIHVLTEANGLPLAIHLTPGQAADISAAPDLIALGQTRPRSPIHI